MPPPAGCPEGGGGFYRRRWHPCAAAPDSAAELELTRPAHREVRRAFFYTIIRVVRLLVGIGI
jgi:hypothetical protein